ERFGHLDNEVRLDVPATLEGQRSRSIFLLARGCAGIDPLREGFDVMRFQPALVGEVTEVFVRKPWRHLLRQNRILDGASPGPRLFVGEERHRGYLAGPVAALAVGLQ